MPTLFVSLEDILAMLNQLSTDELERLRDAAAKKYGDKLKAYSEAPTDQELAAYYRNWANANKGPYAIVDMIKKVRESRGLSLLESKCLVDSWRDKKVIPT